MSSHRKAPKPASMRVKATKGTCRWCGQPCAPRRTWHLGKGEPNCLRDYQLINDPSFTRQAVWERDKGKCAKCGWVAERNNGELWQHDHIKPLCEAQGDITYWQMSNLQTLCSPCHRVKTTEDVRRLRRSQRGQQAETPPLETSIQTMLNLA